jgi:hypothetical protein
LRPEIGGIHPTAGRFEPANFSQQRAPAMGDYRPDHKECEGCVARFQQRPPCVLMRINDQHDQIALYPSNTIGDRGLQLGNCPFVASWENVKHAAKLLPSTVHCRDEYTARELKNIRTFLDTGRRPPRHCDRGKLPLPKGSDPVYCRFMNAKGGPGDTNRHVYYDDSDRTTVFLRKLPPADFQKFWNWFQAQGLLNPVATMGPYNRFQLMLSRAFTRKYLGTELLARLGELTSPTSIAIMAGVIIAIALSPAKFVKFIQNAVYGFGMLAQINMYVRTLDVFFERGFNGMTQDHMDEGAKNFAEFVSNVIQDLGMNVILSFLGKLKCGKKQWDEAAHKGNEVHGEAANTAKVAKQGGMQRWHLEGWSNWAIKNRALVILRQGNMESLPKHFDELMMGKPVDIKWKSIKAGRPNAGLIDVPSPKQHMADVLKEKGKHLSLEEAQKEIDGVIADLKSKGYKFNPEPAQAGSLVMKDGCYLCGDVDKQGVYIIQNGKGSPHPSFAGGDDAAVSDLIQRDVYGGGPRMDQHGAQDFFKVKDKTTGVLKPGRTPTADEQFVAVYPDGHTALIKSVEDLKRVYAAYGIAWPY